MAIYLIIILGFFILVPLAIGFGIVADSIKEKKFDQKGIIHLLVFSLAPLFFIASWLLNGSENFNSYGLVTIFCFVFLEFFGGGLITGLLNAICFNKTKSDCAVKETSAEKG